LLAYTRTVLFLDDLDRGVVTKKGVEIWDADGKTVERPTKRITWSQAMARRAATSTSC
jgi:glucosamine 6-phosphate synthetase-like amidotransferase/phosphosugar isomerase protein